MIKKKIIITGSQFDKVISKYFEMLFKPLFFDVDNVNHWKGFYSTINGEKKLILGTKTNLKSPWFCLNEYFDSKLFDIETWEMNKYLKDFVNKNYNLGIEEIY